MHFTDRAGCGPAGLSKGPPRRRRCAGLMPVVALLGVAGVLLGARDVTRIIRPVCPDVHYPANPRSLYIAVSQYLNEAQVEPRNGRLTAVIAPSSAYRLSGGVAAHSFKLLKPGQYDRVIVMCPSHYAKFRGCSIASVQYYRTPFGDVPVDAPSVRELTWYPLFDLRSVVYRADLYQRGERAPLHEYEHGIEVQLPFLQLQLGEFKLLPIVVGHLEDHRGKFDAHALDMISEALRRVIDDRTLIVVSTNLTRYGPEFGYVPFRDDILRRLGQLDMEALDLILDRDAEGLREYGARTGNNFPGLIPILILLKALPPHVRGTVLNYDTTGRMSGDPRTSVSFVSLAFFDPTLEPPEQKPVKTLLSPASGQAVLPLEENSTPPAAGETPVE